MKKLYFVIYLAFFSMYLSLFPFAAIVSDNDGSAFVTKAEFEKLKDGFRNQIENYNASIDKKIDGAIASYLDGLRLSKKLNMELLYPTNALWSSKTNYSYDSNGTKYLKLECNFEELDYDYWSQFKYLYNNDLYYETMVKNSNNRYEFKKIQFRLWGNIWFWRGYVGFGNAGHILWSQFWPTSMKLGAFTSQYQTGAPNGTSDVQWHNSGQWGYYAVTFPTVYEESKTNTIIAPLSTSTTYTYVPNKEIKGSAGSVVYDSTNYTRIKDVFKATTITAYDVYRNQVVGAETNKSETTNNLTLQWLYDISGNNDKIKYGVCLAEYDTTGSIELKFTADYAGKVKLGTGTDASDAFSNMSEKTVSAGNNTITFDVYKKDGSKIFIMYLPTDTTKLGKLTSMTAMLTTE